MKNGFFTLLLGVIIGAGGYYYMAQEEVYKEEIIYPSNFAQVNQVSGLYIFQNSIPASSINYSSIEILNSEVLNSIIKEFGSKDKTLIERGISFIEGSMSAEKKLDIIIDIVKDEYPNADAIVLNNGFKECEILELNSL